MGINRSGATDKSFVSDHRYYYTTQKLKNHTTIVSIDGTNGWGSDVLLTANLLST